MMDSQLLFKISSRWISVFVGFLAMTLLYSTTCHVVVITENGEDPFFLYECGYNLTDRHLRFSVRIDEPSWAIRIHFRTENIPGWNFVCRLEIALLGRSQRMNITLNDFRTSFKPRLLNIEENREPYSQELFQVNWNDTYLVVKWLRTTGVQILHFDFTQKERNLNDIRYISIKSFKSTKWTIYQQELSNSSTKTNDTSDAPTYKCSLLSKSVSEAGTSHVENNTSTPTFSTYRGNSDQVTTGETTVDKQHFSTDDAVSTNSFTSVSQTDRSNISDVTAPAINFNEDQNIESTQPASADLSTAVSIKTERLVNCTMVEELQNVSSAELQEMVKQLQSELVVNRTKLSSFVRAKTSANDPRTSSVVMGYLGVIIIITLIGGIMLLDLPDLIRFVKGKKPQRRQQKYP